MSFFLFIALSLSSLFTTTEPENIVWNETRPLTWEDFKGKPEKRFAAAHTNYNILKSIEQQEQGLTKVEIKAVFYPYRSWKKRNWVNNEVLIHEQKHFDIVELYARKLRQKIKNIKNVSAQELVPLIDSLYVQNEMEMDTYQDKYDDETNGSMNGEAQRIWNKAIVSDLKELKDFTTTHLNIKLIHN